MSVAKISQKNDVVTIAQEQCDIRPFVGAPIFMPFPFPALPPDTPEHLMDSILLYQSCDEVVHIAKHLLCHFLQREYEVLV
jgi:hypothetical protein